MIQLFSLPSILNPQSSILVLNLQLLCNSSYFVLKGTKKCLNLFFENKQPLTTNLSISKGEAEEYFETPLKNLLSSLSFLMANLKT